MKSRGTLRVASLATAPCARWDAFVESLPQASFFHLSGWAQVIEEAWRHRTFFLYAERDGQIEGVLPLALTQSWLTGCALVSLPGACEAGLVAATPEAATALETEAQLIAEQFGAHRLELRHAHTRHPAWPMQDLYVRFDKPIAPEDEANLAAIPRKQRAVVRKGIAAGLVGAVEAGDDTFFRLYADNTRRHGSPALSRQYFALLREVFGPRCEVLTVKTAQGVPVSSVWSFFWRDSVLPYYAGDLLAARSLYANDFKYWALMCHARARGCRRFDYGRSKRGSGSFDFKKNWGAQPQPLYYEYPLLEGPVPQHNPNNPKYRALIAVWKRLPQPLANALGPHVVRHFL